MICEKCKAGIDAGEQRELHGRLLCEDCYMDALSPTRACDPWAVHSAKSFVEKGGAEVALTELQSRILRVLKETGGSGLDPLSRMLSVEPSELERQIAVLRHLEKVRAELRDGMKIIRLW